MYIHHNYSILKKPYFVINEFKIHIFSKDFIVNIAKPDNDNPKYFKDLSEALEVFEILKTSIDDMRKIILTLELDDKIIFIDEFSKIDNFKPNIDSNN